MEKSRKHGVSSRLLAAILMQESRYSMTAKNLKTKDFGIAQINYRNIEAMGLSLDRLMSDMDYAVEAGAKILAGYKRYSKRETNWFCRYNAGTADLEDIEHVCVAYVAAVERWM